MRAFKITIVKVLSVLQLPKSSLKGRIVTWSGFHSLSSLMFSSLHGIPPKKIQPRGTVRVKLQFRKCIAKQLIYQIQSILCPGRFLVGSWKAGRLLCSRLRRSVSVGGQRGQLFKQKLTGRHAIHRKCNVVGCHRLVSYFTWCFCWELRKHWVVERIDRIVNFLLIPPLQEKKRKLTRDKVERKGNPELQGFNPNLKFE